MMLLSSSSLATRFAQPFGRDLDHLAGVAHDRAQVRRRAGQQVDLAEEPVRAVDRDDAVLVAVALHDRDRARLDQEEVVAGVALAEQDLTGRDVPHRSDRAQPRPLLVAESGKRAVTVDRLLEAGAERRVHHRVAFARGLFSGVSVCSRCSRMCSC